MNLWKWKRTSRLEGGQPAAAIRSSRAEAGTSEAATTSAAPVDIAVPDVLPTFTLPPAGVSLERSFCQDGFVVVPQVFDQTEMAELRRAAIAQFPDNRPPFEPQFSSTAVFQEPFRLVFRNRKFIQALRAVLGEDFVFVNEFGLHDSFYVGWHTDTATPEGKVGHEFHWSPGFCVVQIAIYLQDNNENGGGLDVVPGSYVRDDPFAASMRREHGLPIVNRMPEPSGSLPGRGFTSMPSRRPRDFSSPPQPPCVPAQERGPERCRPQTCDVHGCRRQQCADAAISRLARRIRSDERHDTRRDTR